MMDEEFGKLPSDQEFERQRPNRIGAVNVALLFGTAAIALTLILTPLLAPGDDQMTAGTMGYDDIKTGSIPSEDGKIKRYTIRRSVLQKDPGEVCIIDQDRNKSGC
jgi:hypothetical protein